MSAILEKKGSFFKENSRNLGKGGLIYPHCYHIWSVRRSHLINKCYLAFYKRVLTGFLIKIKNHR